MVNIAETVASFLEEYNLTNKTLCVGFSGGYDSMCLLHVLYSLRCNVAAAHLNHNWRGTESLQEEINCRDFCSERNIRFYSEVLPDDVPHTEAAAREARYEFFRRAMKNLKADCILTAHNADDNAETVLYRIVKGTGLDGLCAIAPKRDFFYRPLLNIRRSDIEKYCAENQLSPNIDSSNADTKYNRNFIRHKIFPLLKEINPEVVSALNSLSSIANDVSSVLNTDNTSSVKEFVLLPRYTQGRIIKELLVQNNLDYDRERIEYLSDFVIKNSASKSGARCSLGDNIWFFVNSEYFEVVAAKKKYTEEVEVKQEGEYDFGDYIFSIERCNKLPEVFPCDSEYCAYVFFNNIDFVLRTRRNGDIIYPLGGCGRQKLKKYFNEKKLPFYKKDEIVLLCEGNEVLWAAGVGLSDKIKVADKVSHVIKLIKKGG